MGQSKPLVTKTILVVDDEAIIRFALADFFEDEGYQVFEAENAEQAIAILERHGGIRIVLTDIEMPGSMDGLRLAHYIRERYPPTLLLLASGKVPIPSGEMPTHSVFFSKPFDPTRVLEAIDARTR